MIRKVYNTLRGNKIYNDADIHEIKVANEIYEDFFKEMSTPAPISLKTPTSLEDPLR